MFQKSSYPSACICDPHAAVLVLQPAMGSYGHGFLISLSNFLCKEDGHQIENQPFLHSYCQFLILEKAEDRHGLSRVLSSYFQARHGLICPYFALSRAPTWQPASVRPCMRVSSASSWLQASSIRSPSRPRDWRLQVSMLFPSDDSWLCRSGIQASKPCTAIAKDHK